LLISPHFAKILQIGYGTGTAFFKSSNFDKIDQSTVTAIKTAISLGYYHLDGAELYNTEAELGITIKESNIKREDLFITTKAIKNISGAIDASLKRLQLDYVDLYLIHGPWFSSSDAELQATWAEMENVCKSGKAKAIGVSNYLISHLEATLATATITPAVNQVEFQPYLQRQNLLPWCKSKGFTLSAFGPLTTFRAKHGPVDDVIASLAEKYSVSEEAVTLRWCIEQGVVAITTSGKEARLRDYLGATMFSLSEEEVQEIGRLGDTKHFRANHFMHDYAPDDRS
jgi:diketogulonate reductase-like aldo/keto reductase